MKINLNLKLILLFICSNSYNSNKIIKMPKDVIIIYGIHDIDDIENYLKLDFKIYLIEPRKFFIDKIKYKFRSNNLVLISRGLTKSNTLSNNIFYSVNNKYSFQKPNQLYYNKEQISVTSLLNIIKEYHLQNIKYFYINLDVDNLSDILESIKDFEHIVSKISFHSDVVSANKNIIYDKLTNFKISNDETTNSYIVHINKNINIPIPKICLYNNVQENVISKLDNYNLFINQYNIDILKHDSYRKRSTFYFEWLCKRLEDFFVHQTELDEKYDILIQFNPKFFENKDMFKIYYPIKDNELYLDKNLDIIYSNKNTMYMLFQILKSKYFTDYLEEKKLEKPSLFKLFEKRYLYEYISKIFVIKNI